MTKSTYFKVIFGFDVRNVFWICCPLFLLFLITKYRVVVGRRSATLYRHPSFWGLTLNKVEQATSIFQRCSLLQNLILPVFLFSTLSHPFPTILSVPKAIEINFLDPVSPRLNQTSKLVTKYYSTTKGSFSISSMQSISDRIYLAYRWYLQ